METAKKKKYILKNLDCADCAIKIEEGLKKLDSVSYASVNFATGKLEIEASNLSDVIERVKKIEPEVEILPEESNEKIETEKGQHNILEIFKILSAFLVFIGGIVFEKRLHSTPYSFAEYLVFIPVYLYSGKKVLLSALKNIGHRNFLDENFLMTIATVGAIFIHALPEAAGVMLFFTVGEYFENLALNRSRRSIKSLLAIQPTHANLIEENEIRTVSPEEIKPGQNILIKPGEKVPLDGIILKGEALVDTQALTGESLPKPLKEGDTILAGTIVKNSLLTVRVEKPFNESSVYRILELVERAAQKKAKTEKFITSFARYYTPAVVGLAFLIAVLPPIFIEGATFYQWLYRALVILVISCPCALVISIPLGYFGGIGSASKRGILVKGSNYLDIISKVHTIVFDKTGTLTKGSFKVTEIMPRNGYTEQEVLGFAALAEVNSSHPISAAILEAYKEYQEKVETTADINIDNIKVEKQEEISGHGIKAIVEGREIIAGNDKLLHREHISHTDCEIDKTVVYVAVDRQYYGYILISDEVKPQSAETISKLKKMGVKRTVMLTGDNEKSASAVARELGIDFYYSGLLPDDKVRIIEEIISGENSPDTNRQQTSRNQFLGAKGTVAFVGDGINDAPVLTRSDVGIAMGQFGSDAAVESADIVLIDDNPLKIPEAIAIGRKTRRIVWQNIIFALGVKFTFIGFGAFGLAGMWEAVIADVGVALIAIFNALRILRIKS